MGVDDLTPRAPKSCAIFSLADCCSDTVGAYSDRVLSVVKSKLYPPRVGMYGIDGRLKDFKLSL